MKRPVQGWATVVEPWSSQNNHGAAGNCKMKLNLDEVPGVEPQLVKYHMKLTTENRWPEEGMRVAVTVDADNPKTVEPDWDSVFGEMRGGALGYIAEGVASAGGLSTDLSKGPASEEPEPELGVKDLEAGAKELSEMCARGEITPQEMSERMQALIARG
jgi:hypothetical protein